MRRFAQVLASGLLLFSQVAAADGLEGVGRISLLAGWRYTPNDWFDGQASAAGYPASASPGGPVAVGSFGYGAADWIEVSLELFGTEERLSLSGADPVHTYSYGILAGARLQTLWTPSFWRDGVIGFAGLFAGPVVVDVTGGAPATGPEGSSLSESTTTGYLGAAGFIARVGEHWGVGLEARWLVARGGVPAVGSVNAGGGWLTLGVSYLFAPEPPMHVASKAVLPSLLSVQ